MNITVPTVIIYFPGICKPWRLSVSQKSPRDIWRWRRWKSSSIPSKRSGKCASLGVHYLAVSGYQPIFHNWSQLDPSFCSRENSPYSYLRHLSKTAFQGSIFWYRTCCHRLWSSCYNVPLFLSVLNGYMTTYTDCESCVMNFFYTIYFL